MNGTPHLRTRVRLVWVAATLTAPMAVAYLLYYGGWRPRKDYLDMTALVRSPANVARLAREFELPAGGALAGLNRVYIVDPLGNFMMSYPADVDPSGLRKDLARWLRVSQVG